MKKYVFHTSKIIKIDKEIVIKKQKSTDETTFCLQDKKRWPGGHQHVLIFDRIFRIHLQLFQGAFRHGHIN